MICLYEPQIFPGLIYHYYDDNILNAKITFLVFSSGKVVITGAKTIEQMNKVFKKVLPTLKKFEGVI